MLRRRTVDEVDAALVSEANSWQSVPAEPQL